jgi:uncharacterized protein YwqG
MNSKNLVCWVTAITLYIGVLFWANVPPISMKAGWNSAWASLVRTSSALSGPGKSPVKAAAKLPPPPPPEPLTREQAERLIAMSALVDSAGALSPRLQRSIRISPSPVDSPDELQRGASRMAAVPDVPAGFEWPQFNGDPLHMLAQINLADVAPLDDQDALPKTGWLCFFHACALDPPATGAAPTDAGASPVVYFDEPVETLRRAKAPRGLEDICPPCAVRFWQEWTLPSLQEEPKLIWDDRSRPYYADLCAALTGRPKEAGWHHLLGEAQSVTGSMRQTCELVSQGVPVTEDTDLSAAKLKPKLANAKEWRLLLQVDLDGLEVLTRSAATGEQPRVEPTARAFWLSVGTGNHLYYWIRQADLQARDFSQVWAIRQSDDF